MGRHMERNRFGTRQGLILLAGNGRFRTRGRRSVLGHAIPPSAICIAATSTLFIVSGVLLLLCEKRIPCSEEVSAQASRQRLNLANVAMLTPLAASFAFGVILALNGLRLGADLAFFTALAGLGIGALCPLVVTAIREAAPSPSSVERAVFPVICACMLVLPFMTSAQAFQIVMILAIADLTAYFVNHLSVLVLLAYRKHLKPTYHLPRVLPRRHAGSRWDGPS